jgi:DNA-binding transcriptional MerR regulator
MDQRWTIGELADECGLTVRALRHFEELGLLGDIGRTSGGRRSYDRADVERVYRVVALRSLGLPLARIAAALESPAALRESLSGQLAQLDRQLADLTALRGQVAQLLDHTTVSIEELTRMIRRTVISQEILHEYLSDAEQTQLAQRGAELGAAGQRDLSVEYPRLYRAAQVQLDRGTAPDDPAMQQIAAELEHLADAWAPGSGASDTVQRMWAERSADITGHDYGDLAEYVRTARAHYRATR